MVGPVGEGDPRGDLEALRGPQYHMMSRSPSLSFRVAWPRGRWDDPVCCEPVHGFGFPDEVYEYLASGLP